MNRNYENLANDIVIQAVKDYRTARKKLKRKPWDQDANRVVKEVEQFFRSKYFGILTGLNPEVVLHQLEQENA